MSFFKLLNRDELAHICKFLDVNTQVFLRSTCKHLLKAIPDLGLHYRGICKENRLIQATILNNLFMVKFFTTNIQRCYSMELRIAVALSSARGYFDIVKYLVESYDVKVTWRNVNTAHTFEIRNYLRKHIQSREFKYSRV